MTYSGVLTNPPKDIDKDGFASYALDDNTTRLIKDWLEQNRGQEVSFRVVFIEQLPSKNNLLGNFKYVGTVSHDEPTNYDNLFVTVPNIFQITSTGDVFYGRSFNFDTVLLFTKFTEEQCAEYGVEYVSIDVDDE